MSEKLESIRNYMAGHMERVYPNYPFALHTSPDDDDVLCMLVFAVPSEKVAEVKAFIREIRENEIVGEDILVLPMIKDMDVTREHYPEHSPKQTPPACGIHDWSKPDPEPASCKWLKQTVKSDKNSYTEQLSSDFFRFAVCHGKGMENSGFNPNESAVFDILNDELQFAA